MNINQKTFEIIKQHKAQLVAVTKYWNATQTLEIIDYAERNYPEIFMGIGENRIESLLEKGLDYQKIHMIGNLQSRSLKKMPLVQSIHSLYQAQHVDLLDQKARDWKKPLDVFLQVKLSQDPLKFGLGIPEIEALGAYIVTKSHLTLKGFSAMGAAEFTVPEKIKEFQTLVNIRDQYDKSLLLSAGTSRDFEIALGEGIDIVRIGHKLIHG